MLGGDAFSEVALSETTAIESVAIGSHPIIYFNSSMLTFPLNINTMPNFSLDINTLQNHELLINQMMNFTARR